MTAKVSYNAGLNEAVLRLAGKYDARVKALGRYVSPTPAATSRSAMSLSSTSTAPLLELDAVATAELAPLVERAVGSARLSTAR
jgi:hypothetical protein